MTWEMLYAKNYFVAVVVVVVISFLWYYLHELSPENFAIHIYIYIYKFKNQDKPRHNQQEINQAVSINHTFYVPT